MRSICSALVAGGALMFQAAVASSAGVPAAPEDGGPRHFEVTGVSTYLNLRQAPSVSASIVGRVTAGAILTNLGCQAGVGRAWCYVQEFRGGPAGFVDAAYLSPAVSPDGSVAEGPNDSSLRAGQANFDATGGISCSQQTGQPMTECRFGVARAGGGDATVVITKPDGAKRAIFFIRGIAMSTDSSEADPASFRFEATKESDLHLIRIGDERYEIPDAVVFGG